MFMARSTNKQIADRVATLKAMILSGSSNSVCVAHAAQQWGLSRRHSYRLLKRAWSEVREDVNATGVDRQEMLCWTIHQLMAAAGEGVKNKQPSVTVGACRELDALLGLGVNSANRGRYGWRR